MYSQGHEDFHFDDSAARRAAGSAQALRQGTEEKRIGNAARFLAGCADDDDLFCLTWLTLMSYLRIATHPSIFSRPLSPSEALANISGLLEFPRVRVVTEDRDFLAAYRKNAASFPVRGNLVPDAHLATVLRQHGVRILYTFDVDFRKFDFLDVRKPFPF